MNRHTSKQAPLVWLSSVKTRNSNAAARLNTQVDALCTRAFELFGPRAFECPKSAAAAHEAGHCVFDALEGAIPLNATIWPIKVAGQTRWIGRTTCNLPFRSNAETSPQADLKFAKDQLAGVIAEALFDPQHYRIGSSLNEIAAAQLAINNAAIKSSRDPQALWFAVVAELSATLRANRRIAREIADVLMHKHVIRGSRLKKALARRNLTASFSPETVGRWLVA